MHIQKRTIKRLRSAAGNFFPDDEAYHQWLAHDYKVSSTLDLSEQEGRAATDAVNAMQKARRKRQFGPRKGNWLSFKQKEYIEGLFAELHIPKGKRQVGFIKKQINEAKAVDWLSPKEASKVITGLKRFKESGYSSTSPTAKAAPPSKGEFEEDLI